MIYKLENLKQAKKRVEQVMTEFKQLIGQAGLTTRSMSDNIHLIGLFRKALNYSLKGNCFKCRKTGHRVADCPEKENRKEKKEELKKVDPVKNAFATIRASTKDEREAFAKMIRRIFELEDWINASTSFYYDLPCTSSQDWKKFNDIIY